MHKSLGMLCVALLLLMAGCIPSVHPVYTEQDLIFDPALVGQWVQENNRETWTFTKSGEKQYKLVYVDEGGKKGEFVAHLLTVSDRRFLDFYPKDPDLEQNDFYKAHLLPVHTFMRVQQRGDSLQMAFLKQDWLEKLLEKNADAVKHETLDGTILLTAQPKDLQAFLIQYDKTSEAWDEGSPMTRRKEKAD